MLSILVVLTGICQTSTFTERWNGFLNYAPTKLEVDRIYSVHATFENHASNSVNLYKVSTKKKVLNPLGLLEAFLKPGESIKIDCMTGDTFTARVHNPGNKNDGKLLLSHDVSMVHINDNDCSDDTVFTKCERREFTADMRWTPPDSLLFYNHLDRDVLLYYKDVECEEKSGLIEAGKSQHVQSTMGHTFRIRDSITNKLIQTHTLQAIPIKNLENDEDERISEKATELFDVIHLKILQESLQAHSKLIDDLTARIYNKKIDYNQTISKPVELELYNKQSELKDVTCSD